MSSSTIMPACIETQYPLAEITWFRVGGFAEFFAQPKTISELQETLIWAASNKLPVTILGKGANVLISDEGIKGVTIRMQLTKIEIAVTDIAPDKDTVFVKSQAGCDLQELITWCLQHNIIGLEEFSGIPGSVGASVFINLHYFQFLLAHFIVSALVMHRITGELQNVDRAWFEFGYNYSKLFERDYILVDVTFALQKGTDVETAYAHGRRIEIIRHRNARYPQERTCGSFFRNFLPHEVSATSNGTPLTWVAYYLDAIGCKGKLSNGKALVSHKHANMIVTQEGATANDVITLARTMQQRVFDSFGIIPQPECQLLGFSNYPLLTEKQVCLKTSVHHETTLRR